MNRSDRYELGVRWGILIVGSGVIAYNTNQSFWTVFCVVLMVVALAPAFRGR